MKKVFNAKKLYIKLLIILFVAYFVSTLISQQSKINSYKESQSYYQSKIEEAEDYQESLSALKENVNSKEYIEEIARDKLDMYLPNERVYVDISK
ncbi:MAG: septum formation initiator family protein [Clostridia bacterium]|nr:septum formation initiator family protein [Clostridia bacterium]